MEVASMLSAGYLQPGWSASASEAWATQRQSASASEARAARRQSASEDIKAGAAASKDEAALARGEQDVLRQEQELKARAGAGTEVHTIYHYALGPDGRRYISGASVTMRGEEDDIARATGGVAPQEIEAREDEAAQKVSGAEEEAGPRSSDDAAKGSGAGQDELSEEEEAKVRELQSIEREVVAHEAAHQAAAGRFGGPVSYSYTKGPDGKDYITGGEVPIRMEKGATPEETIRNMQQVQRAATAPADPSGQDRSVAAQAAAIAAQARSEMMAQRREDAQEGDGPVAKVAEGTPVRPGRQEEDDPAKKGVSSLMASVRALQIQDRMAPAA